MQGRFANVAAYDDIELPMWKDFSPRVSAVYNLRATARPRSASATTSS
jgi:hypothetical protein